MKKYYPRAYKRLFLQDRDLELLRYCLEQKFLTVRQVAERFFHPKEGTKDKDQAAYRRVLILQRFGLLKICPLRMSGQVIQVTPLGAHELNLRNIEHLPPPSAIDHRTAEHDRRVTDFRILLDILKLISQWESERYLKAKYSNRVPDAIFTLSNGQRVALEIEIARKAKDRYTRILKDYLEKSFGKIDLLFYVCQSPAQVQYLSHLTRDYRWVYYTLFDDLKDKERATFSNQADRFCFKEIL